MSNHWFAILTLTLICSLPLEFTEQNQSTDARVGTATVSGRVTIKGEPAQGVTVFLKHESTRNELSGKTDENGYFRITGLPAGRYTPMPLSLGYLIPRGSTDGMVPRGRMIHVAEGEIIENVDIELTPGGVITGRVTGSNDRPLVEEQVELWWFHKDGTLHHFNNGVIRKMLTTDDRGIYRIFGLPEGRYLLCAGGRSKGEDGYLQKTYHPNVTDQSQAKVVRVGEGEEITGVDINVAEVKKTYRIFGRVVNAEDGQPVSGATINLQILSLDGSGKSGEGFANSHSNSKGEFQFSNVPTGKYVAYMAGDPRPDSVFYSEAAICEVNDSDIQGIEIKLRKGGSISGVVVLEDTTDPTMLGKIGAITCIFDSVDDRPGELSSRYFKLVRIAPNGSFKVEGVPKSKVRIQTFPPINSYGSSLVRIERDGVPQTGNTIEISAEEHISNLRLVTAIRNLSLRGEIKIVGGTLPPALMLSIYASRGDDAPGNNFPFQVDARNHFVIEHLSSGEYELRLKISDYQFGSQNADPQLSQKISKVRQKVVVSRNNQQPVILILDLSQGGGNR
jgi:5-hydroxyisourate hydrolase-like protein (transthyretin family)